MLLALLALLSLSSARVADTTVTVQRGDRLEMSVHTGDITIHTWNRNVVQARGSDGEAVVLARHGTTISIGSAQRRHGGDDDTDYEITVPVWMDLSVTGVNGNIRITGSEAGIAAQTVEGDVVVEGGNGVISLQSVDGSVSLSHGRGKITLGSVNSDVTVDGATGQLAVETVNGEIKLGGMDSDDVDANTVNGDVTYDGPIRPAGRYRFVTHNGDLTVSVQEGASAVVSVSTYQGDFESDFPVTTRGSVNKRFSLTLGSGSARLELESFQGTIRLVRPEGAPSHNRSRR